MDTVTYPDEAVSAYVSEHFAALKINMFDKHPDFKRAIGDTKVLWAPVLIFSDEKGREIRRFIGWFSPKGFLAQLRFARALACVNRIAFDEARACLQEILDDFGDTEVVPEALYWHGISGFLAGKKDMNALRESWEQLAAKYPGSQFATHASVIEDLKLAKD